MLTRSLRRLVPSLVALTFLAAGCATSSPKSELQTKIGAGATAGKSSMLSRELAMFRSRQIHKLTYQLWFGLDENGEEFAGRTKILFDIRENAFANAKKLRLDFTGGKITSIAVNGNPWDAEKLKDRYNGEWIDLPKSELPLGQNKIEIAYTHAYSESGNGLYRFKDPEDGKVYFRTDLEPYYANLVFPCFDQPDLKASFEVTAEVPTDWTVIGNMPVREKTKVDSRLSWQFAPSPQMSTYLFALAAGPWKEWKDDAEGLPLGLYTRQSQAKYFDAAEWFHITKKGLEFYSEFFGYPYPFAKYDQILIPDMNAGAMENIGAVTFSESFIFRGPKTEDERRNRADTILHEMAHMWFGDLVTMRWWNGLWLNESFATYMASVAIERTKLFPGAPQAFFAGMKRWAYSEDQLPTTHPIEVSVTDTDQAMANFDGITYGKGAAALKQFHFLMGDEDFQEGLHRYFSRFANRNTSLADFIGIMGQTSDRSLTTWTKNWLQTTGYDTISVDYACAADEKGRSKITKFDLVQTAPGIGNTLRSHQLEIGLYHQAASGRLEMMDKAISVAFEGDRFAVDDAIGKKCPDFVFPNQDDHGYFAVNLDPKSLEIAKASAAKISDPFTRHLVIYTLWEMVRSSKWKLDDFATAALGWIATETNKTLLEDLSGMLDSGRSGRISVARLLEGEARTRFRTDLYHLARKKTENAAPGGDLQRIWFELALRTLPESEADWALKLSTKKSKISGLKIDLDLRWQILRAVARVKAIDPAVLDTAAKDDPSSEGQTHLLEVKAASLDAGGDFPALFTLEKTDPTILLAKLRKAAGAYLNYATPERTQAWRPKFFASLESVAAKSDESYSRMFASALFPTLCQTDVGDETTKWLADHPKAPTGLRITLTKMAFSEKWCAAIRAGREFPLWATKPDGEK
jgi:aminopeptidase N